MDGWYLGCELRRGEARETEEVDSSLRALLDLATYLEPATAERRTEAFAGRRELPAAARRRH